MHGDPQAEIDPHARRSDMAIGTVVGFVAGTGFMNRFFPPEIYPSTGVELKARVSMEPGVTVNWGTFGGGAPHAFNDGPVGINYEVAKFNLDLHGPNNVFKTVARLAHQLPAIADQTQLAVAEHLVAGGLTGVIIGAYAVYKVGKELRQSSMRERLRNASPLARLAALAVSATVLVSGGQIAYEDILHPQQTQRSYLSKAVTDDSSKLQGAYLTGLDPVTEADAERDFTYVSSSYNNNSSNPQRNTAIDNFRIAWNKAEQTYLYKYTNNPNDEQVVQIGDVHCYYPGYALLGAELTQIGPDVIVENGDIETNSGQAPYEDKCIPDEIKAFKAAAVANLNVLSVVRVNGNHDAKESININDGNLKIYTLRGNSNTLKVAGMTFVGEDDPRSTTFSTQPDGRQLTDKALASQGSNIATAACKITETTGQAPFVISHAEQGSFESLLKGCARIVFNAHTHVNGPVNVFYGRDGLKEYQHTVGTATGVGVGITIYQTPDREATVTDWFINKRTHKPDAVVTVSGHTNQTVSIENQPLNGDPQIPSDYENYVVSHYSPTAKVPVKISIANSK